MLDWCIDELLALPFIRVPVLDTLLHVDCLLHDWCFVSCVDHLLAILLFSFLIYVVAVITALCEVFLIPKIVMGCCFITNSVSVHSCMILKKSLDAMFHRTSPFQIAFCHQYFPIATIL